VHVVVSVDEPPPVLRRAPFAAVAAAVAVATGTLHARAVAENRRRPQQKPTSSAPKEVPAPEDPAAEPSPSPTPMSTAAPLGESAPPSTPTGSNHLVVALGLAIVAGAGIFFFQRGSTSSGMGEGDPIPIPRRGDDHAGDDHGDGPEAAPSADRAERLGVRILATHPHDPRAFTQGLVWHEGALYEGTGLYGRSTIRRVDLATGEVQASEALPREIFGEGIALAGDRFFQITWQEGIAYERRLSDLGVIREIPYEGEGWGICHDGTRLVMSDGSARLFFRNQDTFALEGEVTVTLDGRELDQLNELECVEGLVYANVWQTDHIARIDPSTGRVTGWIDTSLHEGSPEGARMLEPDDAERADVLNGIAWVPERQHFLIGGKEWPHLFEVEFIPASE
jgi:glutamine cyclotransferase